LEITTDIFISKQMLKNNLTIFPTSRAIRDHIEAKKQTNTLLQKYITIGDFFARVIIQDTQKEFCDKNQKILFLQTAIKNIDIKSLGLSDQFSTFIKQSEYIFRFFSELNSEYVTIDDLLVYDIYALYESHLRILDQIFKNYYTILDKYNYTDSIFLPLMYKINFKYLEQFDTIEIYQEGYLTKFELNILKEISKNKQLIINIIFNQYNQKNKNIFKDLELKDNIYYRIDLSKMIILDQTNFILQNQNIQLSAIKSSIEQIAFIKYHIVYMVNKGIDPSKIAVLLPDESFSSTLQVFDNEHYFNFAMGKTIKDHKIVKIVEFINKIMVDNEPLDKIKLAFFSLDQEILTKYIKQNWNKDLTKENFDTVISYLYSFEQNEDILEQLENLKYYLKNLIFNTISTIDIKLKEFFKIFYNELIKITIDDTAGGKITVLGILETRLTQFDGIIVVDFNDNKIPKISVKDKFLSSKLKELVDLPSLDDRYNLQRYYYKRFLDNAKYISMCYVDDDTSIKSRFITQLYPQHKEFIRNNDYSTILYKNSILTHLVQDIVLDIDLSTLQWSATSLKSYLSCKRQYYFKHILKLHDHHIGLKPQNFEIGNIIHDTLESAIKNKTLTNQFINDSFNKYAKSNPYLTLELELWKKRLEPFVKEEEKRYYENGFSSSVEVPFKIIYNNIKLTGKIDRIDKYPNGYHKILDYKTSSSLKIDTIKTYKDSVDFQLEFYYLASRSHMIDSVCYYDLYNCKIIPEVVLEEKLQLLDNHLKTLKTTKVDFAMTQDTKQCTYCTYKAICAKGL